MLGAGDLQSGEPYLAGSAHKPVALLSSATAHRVGAETKARITGPSGYLDLDVVVIDMPDDVVWVPQNSHGCQISHIGARAGDTVSVSAVPQEVAK
jgi:NADH-quinone oxidoreductase subunit G